MFNQVSKFRTNVNGDGGGGGSSTPTSISSASLNVGGSLYSRTVNLKAQDANNNAVRVDETTGKIDLKLRSLFAKIDAQGRLDIGDELSGIIDGKIDSPVGGEGNYFLRMDAGDFTGWQKYDGDLTTFAGTKAEYDVWQPAFGHSGKWAAYIVDIKELRIGIGQVETGTIANFTDISDYYTKTESDDLLHRKLSSQATLWDNNPGGGADLYSSLTEWFQNYTGEKGGLWEFPDTWADLPVTGQPYIIWILHSHNPDGSKIYTLLAFNRSGNMRTDRGTYVESSGLLTWACIVSERTQYLPAMDYASLMDANLPLQRLVGLKTASSFFWTYRFGTDSFMYFGANLNTPQNSGKPAIETGLIGPANALKMLYPTFEQCKTISPLSGHITLDASTLNGLTVQEWFDKNINNKIFVEGLSITLDALAHPNIFIRNVECIEDVLYIDINGNDADFQIFNCNNVGINSNTASVLYVHARNNSNVKCYAGGGTCGLGIEKGCEISISGNADVDFSGWQGTLIIDNGFGGTFTNNSGGGNIIIDNRDAHEEDTWQRKGASGTNMFPDYANMESISRITTYNGTWTADRDGYVFCRKRYEAQSTGDIFYYFNVRINNKAVYYQTETHRAAPAGTILNHSTVLAVKKGDVITFEGTDTPAAALQHMCYFIPPLWVAPPDTSLMNFPNQWVAGQEYDFGNNLYGKRIAGSITAAVSATNTINIVTSATTSIVDSGGEVGLGETGTKVTVPVGQNGFDTTMLHTFNNHPIRNIATGAIDFVSQSNYARNGNDNSKYDIWIKY
ncbi:MAG: hypothetical protein LBD27_04845, partial [Tannerella sp.]|nr:hypothetical protein [Tannerella sp.]